MQQSQKLPPFNAFVSDLDDTLLMENGQMSDVTEKTLRRLMQQDVRVILASGRMAASIRILMEKVGSTSPYIAYNGAQVVDGKTHEVLHAEEIDAALSRQVLEFLAENNVYAQTYYGDHWYYDQQIDFPAKYEQSTGIAGTYTKSLIDLATKPTPKVLGVAEPERVPGLIEAGRARFGDVLSITTSKPYFLEITSPRATKGNALEALSRILGLTRENTLVAGDSLNDISMLEWAKHAITVENARDSVKALAFRVGDRASNHGIAKLLDELIPEGSHAD